jgi:hypothetical protein
MMSSGTDATGGVTYRPGSSLGQFTAKAAVAGFISFVLAWLMSDLVISKIDDVVERRLKALDKRIETMLPGPGSGKTFWVILEREFERAADPKNDLPPEKKQKIVSDIRAASAKWRPFLADVLAAMSGADAQLPGK